jgi:Flp pilus assembly protein TadG
MTGDGMIARRPTVNRRRSQQGGQVIIEMGLCMTALFFIMFGIVEYARIDFANNFCAFAAQQGARYASIRGSSSVSPLSTSPSPCGSTCTNVASGDPTTTYVKGLAVGLDTSNLTVSTTWGPATTGNGNDAGSTVTVRVQYTYNPLLTIVVPGVSTFSLNSTSTMTVIQ